MISRSVADLLAHLQGKGSSLTGTRLYPGPWHYKDEDGKEYGADKLVSMVAEGFIKAAVSGPDTIIFSITEKGIAAEKAHARGRAQKRQRGAG